MKAVRAVDGHLDDSGVCENPQVLRASLPRDPEVGGGRRGEVSRDSPIEDEELEQKSADGVRKGMHYSVQFSLLRNAARDIRPCKGARDTDVEHGDSISLFQQFLE